MKKLISSLAAIAAIVSSTPAFAQDFGYHTVHGMDALHKSLVSRTITERVLDGSIEPQVRKSHTQGTEFYLAAYNANMWVLEQRHCAIARQTLGLESASCIHFSKSNY